MSEFSVQIKQPVIISGNFEEMQQELSNMMQAYSGLEVTEANLPERKKDIATLRKIKAAIEDKRKSAKKDYEKPFKAFEAECKKLTGIIDTEIKRINDDMDVFEKKRIVAKRETIKRLYEENIGDYAEYLHLGVLMRPQWDNKTYSETAIINDIQEAVMQVKSDLSVIKSTCGEWEDDCIVAYIKYGNSLVSALQRAKDLESAKRAAEASVKASEQQTPTPEPEAQANATESLVDSDKWVFTITVTNETDAKFIRDTCEMFGYEYKEG